MSNDKQFIDFKKEVEKLKEIDGVEEYAKQLAHLFLGNGLSLQTILLMAIDFGQQHHHWIPVEDELPPRAENSFIFSDYVLVCDNIGYMDTACYNFEKNRWDWLNSVTHWMPIVPPRKEERIMKIDFDAFLTWHKNDYNYINILPRMTVFVSPIFDNEVNRK